MKGNQSRVKHIAELFITSIEENSAQLALAIEAGDLIAIASIAHDLKGAGANFYAQGLVNIARHIEDHAKAGAIDGIIAMEAEITKTFEQLHQSLQRHVAEHGSDAGSV